MQSSVINKLAHRLRILPLAIACVTLISVNLLTHSGTAAAATGSDQKPAWAGYAATGKTFSDVSGMFYVPKVVCNGTNNGQQVLFWVGLDGYTSSTVEQIGIQAGCNNSRPTFNAWYEMLPEQPQIVYLPLTLHANDRISAYVSWSASTRFVLGLSDTSTGKSVTKIGIRQANSDRNSAEWIVERGTNSAGNYYPLLDWAATNSMGFYNVQAATTGNQLKNVANYNNVRINMYYGHNLATTSNLSVASNQDQFRVNWIASK